MKQISSVALGLQISEMPSEPATPAALLVGADEAMQRTGLERAIARRHQLDRHCARSMAAGASEQTIGRLLNVPSRRARRFPQGAHPSATTWPDIPGRDSSAAHGELARLRVRARRAVPASQPARRSG